MNDYVILTDSSCDMTQEMADKLGLIVLPLSLDLDGKQYTNYLDGREIGFPDFYRELREGKVAVTSAVNVEGFREVMQPILESGRDVLYLGFSSGLSITYTASEMAAVELKEEFPDRKIYTVDTLCASLGQGLLIYLAAQEKEKGKSIEEVRDFAEASKMQLCHWFTVDDLMFLKRGGRLSAATAILGTMLGIKPILHVDNEGRLISMEKARGRKAAIKRLAEKMEEMATRAFEQTVFISHGDCEDEAKELAEIIKASMGVKKFEINFIGPVIGAHAGPGTIALFFMGSQR